MEIYALYNGRQALFNTELNQQIQLSKPGTSPINFVSLQVIFDSSLDTFVSNDYTKFVLFNINLKDIQAIFPYKMVTVTNTFEGGDITATMFKVILNDLATGLFVSTRQQGTQKVFDKSEAKSVNTLSEDSYNDFINTGGYTYQTFACSASKTGGPC